MERKDRKLACETLASNTILFLHRTVPVLLTVHSELSDVVTTNVKRGDVCKHNRNEEE